MARFHDLPFELLTLIAQALGADSNPNAIPDLATFVCLTRACYNVANVLLYRTSVKNDAECLFWAASSGNQRTLAMALNAGASPNRIRFKDVSAVELQQSSWPASGDFGKRILECASTPMSRPEPPLPEKLKSSFARPLHMAAIAGHAAIITQLLDAGAELHAPAEWMCNCTWMRSRQFSESPAIPWENSFTHRAPARSLWSPLHLAICNKRSAAAQELLARGAQTKARLTGERGYHECASALHFAAGTGQMELAQHILDAGYQSNVDELDRGGYTPLQYAVANGHWSEMPQFLISRGANVDRQGRCEDGSQTCLASTLFHACSNSRFAEALKLVELGADIHISGPHSRRTPLHFTVTRPVKTRSYRSFHSFPTPPPEPDEKRHSLMSALILRGAKIHQHDGLGMLALQYAAYFHLPVAIEILLKAGADPNAHGSKYCSHHTLNGFLAHETPLFIACITHEHRSTYENQYDAQHRLFSFDFLAALEILVNHGASIHLSSRDETLLHILCKNRALGPAQRHDVFTLLLDLGINPVEGDEPFIFCLLKCQHCCDMPFPDQDLHLSRLVFQRSLPFFHALPKPTVTFTRSIKSLVTAISETPFATKGSAQRVCTHPPRICNKDRLVSLVDFLFEMSDQLDIDIPSQMCDILNVPRLYGPFGEIMFARLDPTDWARDGAGLIYVAARYGTLAMVKEALTICVLEKHHCSMALNSAIERPDNEEMVRLLLQNGDPEDNKSITSELLEEAILHMRDGHPSKLLERHWDEEQHSYWGFTRESQAAQKLESLVAQCGPSEYFPVLMAHSVEYVPGGCLDARHIAAAVEMLQFSPRTDVIQLLFENGLSPATVSPPTLTVGLEQFLKMLDRSKEKRPVWLASLAHTPDRLVDIIKLLWARDIGEQHKSAIVLRTAVLVNYLGVDWRFQAVRHILRDEIGIDGALFDGNDLFILSKVRAWYESLSAEYPLELPIHAET